MTQKIIFAKITAKQINEFLQSNNRKKFLLICGGSFEKLAVKSEIEAIDGQYVKFNGFRPNPDYEDIVKGVNIFKETGCDSIIAVGGGSAIDVAKCIKLFSGMNAQECFLDQPGVDTGIPFAAIPTTAGSGSESTHNAVIYKNGEKQSVAHDSLLPDFVILDGTVLKTLPEYQKKCTVMDALCQALESWWSISSTGESRELAKRAAIMIKDGIEEYLTTGSDEVCKKIMEASNLAGQAINITKTTAPHAMSYKLTTTYGLPHGHAVALCLPRVWSLMLHNPGKCADLRGWHYLSNIFTEIADALGFSRGEEAVQWFCSVLTKYDMFRPVAKTSGDIEMLTVAIDRTRLKNNPVSLGDKELHSIYESVVVH